MRGVEPGYGETPLDPEEADALTPQAREIFGDEPKKIDLYEAEQAINHGKALSDLAVLVAKIQSVLIPWLDREQLAGAVPGSG